MEKYKRPDTLEGHTVKSNTGCGHLYVILNCTPEGKLVEVFATLGKMGQCATAHLEALMRSVTLGLKYGIPVEEYIEEMKGIRCPNPALNPSPLFPNGEEILSCADAIAKILEGEIKQKPDEGIELKEQEVVDG